jgi:hypothetical protein
MAENEPVGGLTQANRREMVEAFERDFPTQLRQAQEGVRQSLEQGRAANSALMEFLNTQRGTGPSPLLQLASGLLRPTRAGGFGESLAAGAEGYAGALQQQRQSDLDRAMRIQQLQAATANLGLQATQQQMALANQGLQFPSTLAAARAALADMDYYEAAGNARVAATPGQRAVAAGAAAAPGMPAPVSPVGPQPQVIATPLAPPAAAAPAAPAAAPAPAAAAPAAMPEDVGNLSPEEFNQRFNEYANSLPTPPAREPYAGPAPAAGEGSVEETLRGLRAQQAATAARQAAEQASAAAPAAAAAPQAAAPAPAAAAPAPAAAPPPPRPAAAGASPPAQPSVGGVTIPRAVMQDPRYQEFARQRELALANPNSVAARAVLTRADEQIRKLIEDYSKTPEGRAEITEAEERAKANVRRDRLADIENEEFGITATRGRAQELGELSKGATEGRQMLSRLAVLETMTEDLPSGILGWFSEQGARLGLGSQVPQYEVARAVLEQLIPGQRQGMPGAVSDRDVEMFRRSLPRLMSSPEGRQMVIDTLKSAAEDQVARGRIAREALNRRISSDEATERMDALPSPFERFLEYQQRAGRDAVGRPAQPGGGAQAPALPPGVTNEALDAELRQRGLIR